MDPMNASDPPAIDMMAVAAIVKEACPLEADLMGPSAVEQIVAGREFKTVAGGSHINLVEALTILSGAATVAQFAVQIWTTTRGTGNVPADFDQRVRALVHETVANSPHLMSALRSDAELFDRVVAASKALLPTTVK